MLGANCGPERHVRHSCGTGHIQWRDMKQDGFGSRLLQVFGPPSVGRVVLEGVEAHEAEAMLQRNPATLGDKECLLLLEAGDESAAHVLLESMSRVRTRRKEWRDYLEKVIDFVGKNREKVSAAGLYDEIVGVAVSVFMAHVASFAVRRRRTLSGRRRPEIRPDLFLDFMVVGGEERDDILDSLYAKRIVRAGANAGESILGQMIGEAGIPAHSAHLLDIVLRSRTAWGDWRGIYDCDTLRGLRGSPGVLGRHWTTAKDLMDKSAPREYVGGLREVLLALDVEEVLTQ